ncbi:MAG: isochorismatase family protein [Verrucomicrobia bacterium]|nr:isochorismatase family protein [Verrucomicrobiota bacterium]
MNEENRQAADLSRRRFLANTAAVLAGASAVGFGVETSKATETAVSAAGAIPEPAPQWKKLDLTEILSRPAAFVSISQNKSLYETWGAQGAEKHRERTSLPATIKVVKAARAAKNFRSFSWIGYEVFRENYPQSAFDKVQYETWVQGLNFSAEKKKADNELVDELKALVEPGDLQFNELALQSSFIGTQLPLELSRKRIETIVFTGIHLDWCVEGNTRAARDNGYLPIVIGDACDCQKPEEEPAALRRINNFFAPVISSHDFVKLLQPSATAVQR